MRPKALLAVAVVVAIVSAVPPASAQGRPQRSPSRGDGGAAAGGGQQDRSGGQRAAAPRDGGGAQQPPPKPRAEGPRGNGRREVAPPPPQEPPAPPPPAPAQSGDGNRRAAGRPIGGNNGGASNDSGGRYAVPRSALTPHAGDHRVYVQPRPNYYVYRGYPAYRYVYPSRYYGYTYYDPYFRGDFFWSNYAWQPRGYYGAYYGASGGSTYSLGKLRLRVQPREAEVYIDGYYAGTADDFDGTLQGLQLEAGNYKVEIALPGFAPLQFDVMVQPGRTTTYRGVLMPEP